MSKFIEIHCDGEPMLVNTKHIEEIREHGAGSVIYQAFQEENTLEQDCIFADESYEEIRKMIMEG